MRKALLCGAALVFAVSFSPAWAADNSGPDRPGQVFHVTVGSLPKPYATPAVGNSSNVVARPKGAHLEVPKGFAVNVFADGMKDARFMALAPNGDVFLAQPSEGKVTLLRDTDGDGKADQTFTFADGMDEPHGLALHDGALYVGDLDAVWRFSYKPGQTKATDRTRVTVDGFGGKGGHRTRDIAFGPDGTLYLAIGSANNIAEDPPPRATVQTVTRDGHLVTFASGIRNPVGIAIYPGTDDLYVTTNERDGLGDDLPPDYLTRVRKGDFFGWPYAYTGPHPDPEFGAKRPDLVAKAKVPDVLFHAHSAPLGLVFYEGTQFPARYRGDAIVALHGSWNDGKPTGYKVVVVPFVKGRPTGEYINFVTGFRVGQSSPAQVWGRPAGLLVAKDGSLLIGDDAGGRVWRISYTGK